MPSFDPVSYMLAKKALLQAQQPQPPPPAAKPYTVSRSTITLSEQSSSPLDIYIFLDGNLQISFLEYNPDTKILKIYDSSGDKTFEWTNASLYYVAGDLVTFRDDSTNTYYLYNWRSNTEIASDTIYYIGVAYLFDIDFHIYSRPSYLLVTMYDSGENTMYGHKYSLNGLQLEQKIIKCDVRDAGIAVQSGTKVFGVYPYLFTGDSTGCTTQSPGAFLFDAITINEGYIATTSDSSIITKCIDFTDLSECTVTDNCPFWKKPFKTDYQARKDVVLRVKDNVILVVPLAFGIYMGGETPRIYVIDDNYMYMIDELETIYYGMPGSPGPVGPISFKHGTDTVIIEQSGNLVIKHLQYCKPSYCRLMTIEVSS